jgi:hypothetical protein
LACLYFLLQSCSGHSKRTGDIAHGEATLLDFFTGADSLLATVELFPLLATVNALFPLKEDGLSSLDFLLFSGRGAENVVGDVEGVFVIALGAVEDMFILDTDEFLDALPLDPPFLSLL